MRLPRFNRFTITILAIALIAGFVGVFLFLDLYHSQQDSRRDYAGAVRGLDLIGELQYQAQEARRTLLYALSTTDSNLQVDYADQSRAAEALVTQHLAAFEKLPLAEKEAASTAKVVMDWAAYLGIRDVLIATMLEGDPKAAIARDLRDGVPAFNALRVDIEKTKDLIRQDAEMLSSEVDASFQRSLLRMAGILGLLVVLGGVGAKTAQDHTLVGELRLTEVRLREDFARVQGEERATAELFAAVLRAATEYSIIGTDPHGAITVFNLGAERMLGYRADEVIGKPMAETIHDPTEVAHRATMLNMAPGFEVFVAAARRGEAETREWTYLRNDGTRFPVSLTVTAMRDGSGTLAGFIGIAADITERQRSMVALQTAETKFRTLVEQLPAITYHAAFGEQCAWTYVSPQIFSLLGFSPEEWLASDSLWFEHIHPEDRAIPLEAETVAMRTGSFLAEYRMFTRDGELRWFRDQAVFVPAADPKDHALYGVMMDITATKIAEAHLAQLNKQLMDSSRMAGMAEVATGVLHNVGNVLNSVNVSAGLVLEKLRRSKVAKLTKAAELLTGQNGSLAQYLTQDPNGQKLPGYLAKLGQHLVVENDQLLGEIGQLSRNIEHIKEVVAMQQSYAKVSGVFEDLPGGSAGRRFHRDEYRRVRPPRRHRRA